MTASSKAETFKQLHIPGSPLIVYNIWDAGSAKAVAETGVKAVVSGSHGVANAFGYEDGEAMPFELALENAKRIVKMTELPVSMDIETGYGATAEAVSQTARQVIDSGVIGINLEDQLIGESELRPIADQAARIASIRQVADDTGVHLFINARSDIFKNAGDVSHADLLPAAIERAQAYADAGADGFFVPGLNDLDLITKICQASPLPVNIIRLPGMAITNAELAAAGVARISYGPFPYLDMIEWLKDQAGQAVKSIS